MSDDPDPCSSSDIPRISVAVTLLDPEWPRAVPAVEDLARRAAVAALAVSGAAARALAARDAEISLVLADDATLRRYNRDYRGIDKPTNVLAFPAAGPSAGVSPVAPPAGAPLPLGDVVLALGTIRAEARAQGKPLADHLRHLVVHGVLHLAGYAHADDDGAAAMAALEIDILAGLGVSDPYAPAGDTTNDDERKPPL